MIDAKQILTKLQNDKVFLALLEKVPQDKKEDAIKAINEIVEMGVSAGVGLSSMSSKVKEGMSPEEAEKLRETLKDA
jgi:ribosomal protein L7/L12